ncbi:MAG: hypothetical protein EZS28_019542 [Streblomastix strix]|uniref:Uncharacterized protein n=1 Tax=Streblomastix strix TaxID=222440 RepID=A0A5J4VQY6_9EUKA|nr:MAG: hypothetical protein EZS28_019542 [Streblomastix strix]
MTKHRMRLVLGRMMIAVMEGREEKHYSNRHQNKEEQIKGRSKELLMVDIVHMRDIDLDQASFRNSGKKSNEANLNILAEQDPITVVCNVTSFHMLTEIHRATAEKREGGTWQLHTQIIKVMGYKATLTFRPLADLNVCQTIWLQQWFQIRRKNVKEKPFWFIFNKKDMQLMMNTPKPPI